MVGNTDTRMASLGEDVKAVVMGGGRNTRVDAIAGTQHMIEAISTNENAHQSSIQNVVIHSPEDLKIRIIAVHSCKDIWRDICRCVVHTFCRDFPMDVSYTM